MTVIVNMQEVPRDFGRAASTYDVYAALQREVLEQVVSLLAPYLSTQSTVLDAGCGTGRALEMIPGGSIMGVDIAQPMCRRAAARNMKVACADIQRLPLRDKSVDAVLCSLVMQWVEQRPLAFSEFYRVVRSGGYAMLAVFGSRTLEELRSVLGEERVHSFPQLQAVEAEASKKGWKAREAFSRHVTQHYISLDALMESLKGIGAVNKQRGRKRGLSTPSVFREASRLYQSQFGSGEGVYASWEVHYLLLKKP